MHPLLRSRNTFAAYAAAWVPLGLVFVYLFGASGHVTWLESFLAAVPTVAVLAIVCLMPFYVCRSLPLGSAPVWKLTVWHTIPAMFFSGVVLAANHFALYWLAKLVPGLDERFLPVVPVLAAMAFITYLLSTALHYASQAMERSKQAELLSREAQLRALKAQVNPHFLFNSLNSISALTAIDPTRARSMCVLLSDFLRLSLRLGERISIPFSEELALARTYLNVEQVRFGTRLRLHQHVEDNCCGCEVPPLVIQPLVENAIKHGVATLADGGEITIAAAKNGSGMRVVIENDFDPDAPAASKSGFGIANVRNRLQARYGAAAALEVEIERNRYRVVVSTPCIAARGARA